ncbi:MAG: TOTE conflict system archaeo-eukaryotic primase domain-containing protein [Opitutaceae bacterium]
MQPGHEAFPPKHRIDVVRERLDALKAEALSLGEELRALETSSQQTPLSFASPSPATPLLPEQKIALFLGLFGARRTVYPKLWENAKSGKKGYAPACDNEWRPGICRKPQIKCTDCPHQKFPSLDAKAIEAHLRGTHTIGTYAIREDDSCIFLAADFDGDGWQDDVQAFAGAGSRAGVPVALERSRSGEGAHAWIFFSEPVPAILARRLGTILLAKAASSRPSMSLRAYDRFFPNQDTMPAGGFGNLIALPLAKVPRERGNTIFLSADLKSIPDQWEFLRALHRPSRDELDQILARIEPLPSTIGTAEPASPLFSLQSDERILDLSRPKITAGMMSGDITARLDAALHLPRAALPAAVVAALKRLATFANPVFHEKQRLRFPTYDTPRFIFAAELHPDRLVLPRGTIDEAIGIVESAGGTVTIQDCRAQSPRILWSFQGELRAEQESAVREMAKHEFGVLSAPPGAGKTVMGCALIARHRTSALVLVHRAVLQEQWRQEAARFLGLKRNEIGVWRGKDSRMTGRLDIAMLPSLARWENVAEVFSRYGLVIVDECHHVPAVSFEALLKACPCRHIVGLTATPERKDGLERLLHLQCGPIRHKVDVPANEAIQRTVFVRRSSFHLPDIGAGKYQIHEIWQALVDDVGRTLQVANDVWTIVQGGRSPLVLSDRKAHLDKLQEAFQRLCGADDVAVFRLASGAGIKQRRAIRAEIDQRSEKQQRYVLFSTASLIGEGFDLPILDTLFLAMPLSFKGRLIQYAGRLHRSHADKREIAIYDYLDDNHPVTHAMFRRRATAYRQMGYRFELDESLGRESVWRQLGLFAPSGGANSRGS